MRFLPRLLAAFALIDASIAAAAPFLDVRATATPPRIDGVLDDAAWREAAHSDAFRQIRPLEDADPTERTELWVSYDVDCVYIAVRCHDSTGQAGVLAYSMQRDQDNGSDDFVRLVFDTFNRQRDGYFFALTAAGGMHDGLIQNKNEASYQWDSIWLGRVSREAGGWTAEFAIPVKSLAFDPANDTWGFNLARSIRRKQEFVRWSGYSRAKEVFSLPDLGELRGLQGLRQGLGIDFKPYASVTRHSDPTPDQKRFEFNPGFDLVWHVTPSLAATLTVNTDFADAEVDERQVNLGRFPLFFPEKRGFFTQDASLFAFGGIQNSPLPFFSRRIGIDGDGTKVDLLGGLKITGRVGPWTLGLLDVQTADHAGLDSKNLLVGRAAYQVLSESNVGVVFTRGEPRINGNSSLVGTDFNYVDSHFLGNKTLTANASVQFSDSDYAGGQGMAGILKVNYPNEPYSLNSWLTHYTDKFDPALGFVSRTGVNQVHFGHRYRWYFQDRLVNRIDLNLETNDIFDLHGRRLEGSYTFPSIDANTVAGDNFSLRFQDHNEVLDSPFEIRTGVIIPTGHFRWRSMSVSIGTTSSRPVSVWTNFQHGGFYAGDRNDYSINLGWRPSNHIQLGVDYTINQIRMPQGNFDVRVSEAKAIYTFSPDLQFSLLGQHDNLSNNLGINFRMKWTVQPGSEVFFIVNEGYDTTARYFRPTQVDSSLKGAWTIRF